MQLRCQSQAHSLLNKSPSLELTQLSSAKWFYKILPALLKDTGPLNTLRPRQNGRHFADDIFKCIFLNENVWISIKISLKIVPKGPINSITALVQIMAWRHSGDKPLSEPMMVSLPTHICVTRPQWVNSWRPSDALQWNIDQNPNIFIQENASENAIHVGNWQPSCHVLRDVR